MKLNLTQMVTPWHVNQAWGIYDPATYSQFGFTRHNGIDIALGTGAHVLAPFDGTITKHGWEPQGGGIYVSVMSANEYAFNDGITCLVLMDALHLESILLPAGTAVKAGQLIAIADNTGFSTGPHTHFQLRRVTWKNGITGTIDTNDANNSFDPSPYINHDGFQFLKDLTQGMLADPDIKELQIALNKDPRTRVSPTGAGSPGHETFTFGALTLAAVKRFQALHGVNTTGLVGPLTRAALNVSL